MIHLFSMIWIISCVVLTRQPNFGLGKPRNLNTSNLDRLETMTRAATFALVNWNWWGESFPFDYIWMCLILSLGLILQNSFNHLLIVLWEQSLNKRIVRIKRSRSVFTRSRRYRFQTMFCIFSMSCSWAGLPRATGYSPKYMNYLLLLEWTSFVLKTMCECSSRSKWHYYLNKHLQKQSRLGWRDLILPRSLCEKSRFQNHIWHRSRHQIWSKWCRPQITVSHGFHLWFRGSGDQWIFRYHPTQSELFNPFPQNFY